MPPSKRGKDKGDAPEADTARATLTLQAFTAFELDGLVGIYGPTRAQVAVRIIEEWLHQNEQQIVLRKARHADFLAERSRGTSSKP